MKFGLQILLFSTLLVVSPHPHAAEKPSPSAATRQGIDTDGDGLSDDEEATLGTNPNINDTDGDGVWDGQDGAPLDPDLHFARVCENKYMVVNLDAMGFSNPLWINDSLQILDYGSGRIWSNGSFISLPTGFDWHGLSNTGRTVAGSNRGVYTSSLEHPTQVVMLTKDSEWGYCALQKMTMTASGRVLGVMNPEDIYYWYNDEDCNGYGYSSGEVWEENGSYNSVGDTIYKTSSWGMLGGNWMFTGSYTSGVLLYPSDRNKEGITVGYGNQFSENGSDEMDRAVLSSGESIVFLSNIENWHESFANSINNLPEPIVVGNNTQNGATLWCKKFGIWKEKSLGPYNFTTQTNAQLEGIANKINDRCEIIGDFGGWNNFLQNGKLVDLETRVSGYHDIWPYDINNNGAILATAVDDEVGYNHNVLLLPVELVPDFNRDGKIDDKDRGKVTQDKPYHFWVNDDNDSGDTGGDDIPGAQSPNYADESVNGVRDLIDFFPLSLEMQKLVEILPPSDYTYELRSSDNSLNVIIPTMGSAAVKITEDNCRSYLSGTATSLLLTGPTVRVVHLTSASNQQARLSEEFLNNVKNDGAGVILVEGRTETAQNSTSYLEVHVFKGSNEVVKLSFPIKLSGVEKMFRHKNIRGVVPTWNGFVAGAPDRLGEPTNYPDDLCINKNFICVHGYNWNGDQARGFHSEIFKRMFWSGSRAKFYGVSWSGDRDQRNFPVLGWRTPNFHRSVADALGSASALAQFVNGLNGETTIAAHSLGNLMTSSAQSDYGLNTANFFMVDAAQSLEQYQADAPKSTQVTQKDWPGYQERTWSSEWHALFGQGDGRHSLTWRGRVAGHTGNRFNFYSDVSAGLGDHVMRTPSEQTDDDAVIQLTAGIGAFVGADADGRYAFCLQERLKGHFLLPSMGSTYGGWRLSKTFYDQPNGTTPRKPTPQEAANLTDQELQTHPVFDPGFDIYWVYRPPSPQEPGGFLGWEKTNHEGSPSWIRDLTIGSNGSQTAQQNRNLLLSEMFPARSVAVGGNPIPSFGDRNFDMQSSMHHGWPASRTSGGEPVAWWHGDVKDVSYTYVFPLFDKWVELGGLK
ncbi:MAG: thrombospondin type 3 repeat-containing protein [Verrucomicrobiota bacterium]